MTAPASDSPLPTRSFTRGRRRASISLTPLIDVVFILLIFFMLASSFLDERAIEIDSPAAALGGTSLEGALFVELRGDGLRSEEHTSELQSLMRISYAVFCLKKKIQ